MAFTYGFYNSVNHDRKYDAVQMGMIFDGIITDGIYATYLKAMVVKASENASEVIVQPGRAWFNHTWSYNDSDYPIATPDPEVVLDRIDTLVLDINAEDASRTNSFLWVQGTPTSQIPEPPELIHTATHNQYPLCDVYRKAGTTQIYAADITNRVGTSDCPFVTGVLESINIDDLLAQWDDEFHTWERATKSAFEGWMVNQQSVYTAWWDALKLQMAGDVADVEAWVASLHDILDSETATHLQNEIDEIKTLLPTGSYIKVTTPDPELRNKVVTITDEHNESVTSTFNAQGVAEFKTVPLIGNLTITSTDGIRTATTVVNIEYFSKYSYTLAFWNATVNIQGDEQLGGSTVSIYDSSSLIGTVVLNAEGEGSFSATYPDTYTFSVTYQGETYSQELEVSQETTYTVSLSIGFNYSKWLEYGEVTGTYASLDDVLEDERAVRKLMTKHASVDYLASATVVSNDISKIINNDICAKWINLRDYALDMLYKNSAIKAVMDEADKYGYGELALIDKVPLMTNNTTLSGVASASDSYAGYEPYKTFDNNWSALGTSNHGWLASNAQGTKWLRYMFPQKTTIYAIRIMWRLEYQGTIKFQGSDDGETWTDISDTVALDTINTTVSKYVELNRGYNYKYYQLITLTGEYYHGYGIKLELLGYEPKGAVPVMTANNAPYGELTSSPLYGSNYPAWKAFDSDDTTAFNPTEGTETKFIQHKATNPICVKRWRWASADSLSNIKARVNSYTLLGSNDGSTWETLDIVNTADLTENSFIRTFNNNNYYLYHKVNEAKKISNGIGWNTLQFYGRSLNVSVPVMMSNTAPFGTVSGSGSGQYGSYHAFSNSGYAWNSGNLSAIYDFGKPVVVKAFSIASWHYDRNNYKIVGSNDGSTWTDVLSNIKTVIPSLGDNVIGRANVENTTAYRYYGFEVGASDSYLYPGCNFYGLDYSEREFEPNTNKKWLYDHGLELETFETTGFTDGNYAMSEPTKNNDYVQMAAPSGQNEQNIATFVDLTDYSLVRVKRSNDSHLKYNNTYSNLVIATSKNYSANGSQIAVTGIADISLSSDSICLDISNISGNKYVGIQTWAGMKFAFSELWLEP